MDSWKERSSRRCSRFKYDLRETLDERSGLFVQARHGSGRRFITQEKRRMTEEFEPMYLLNHFRDPTQMLFVYIYLYKIYTNMSSYKNKLYFFKKK